jgi:nitrogen fixation/metabolism regulation signal transduction histidine kinase
VRYGLGVRLALLVGFMLFAAAVCWILTEGAIADVNARVLLAALVAALAALATRGVVARPGEVASAVSDGLNAYSEQDYSMQITSVGDDPWQIARRFNTLGETLRRSHNDVYQKEMLLETVLGATPTAIVLDNEAGRIVYANGTARELLGDGEPLDGHRFDELVAELAPEAREALAGPVDALFSVEGGDRRDVYDVARRYFDINGQRHRLTMIRPLGRELERREAEAWKQAIRVVGHELNNSLAPIASLVNSARGLVGDGPKADKLRGVLDIVEERTHHLTHFLEGFARLARLPRPHPEEVPWPLFLAGVQALHPFTIDGEPPSTPGWFDKAQLQQVLINVVKNAHEAGSPPDEIRVRVTAHDGGSRIQVFDRGQGMTDEVRSHAVLPFYSTKKSGGGIGLALCREIVDAHGGSVGLVAREGGGTIVDLWLPGRG